MKEINVTHWQERLDVIAKETGVVGAVLGILRLDDDGNDELVRCTTGLLNVNTGREVTIDSLFQIGSITKTWTATVVMQLVEEGKIGLDQPVKELLPGFKLSTQEMTDTITVRQLLNHTCGLDGDVFVETGRGDDCLEKFMTVLEDAVQIFPVGATWSYCNTGFSILGRILEVVEGKVWDVIMKERLFTPMNLTHTVTLPEEALLFDTAVGHIVGLPEPVVTPAWTLMRNAGPAGLICASIADLLAFGRLHICNGATPDGTQVLKPETALELRAYSSDVPEKYLLGDSWGLGIERYKWSGKEIFGHDGNTLGQAGFLRFYPEGKLAVALLTNDSSAHNLYHRLFGEIFDELCGITIQPMLDIPEDPPTLDITDWVGTYERASVCIEIIDEEEGPLFRATQKGELAELEQTPVQEYRMIPVHEGLYGVFVPDMGVNVPVWFYQISTGERYIHFGARATRKISS